MTHRLAAVVAGIALIPVTAPAQIQLSGLAEFLGRNSSEEDVTNLNFRPTSNLDMTRVRLFLDAEVSEGAQFFTQFLVSSYSDVFLYGAYLRLQDLGGSAVSVHAGLIPTTVGTWAERTYSDKNPLVGVPLVQNHHSILNPRVDQPSVDALLAQRDGRSSAGLPVLYDNCWNTGVEIYGHAGDLDWSLGVVNGSSTLPQRTTVDKLPQVTGRLAWYSGPALQVGADGWVGPYLFEGMGPAAEAGKTPNDYLNGGFGGEIHATLRYVDVNSEVFRTFWEHPTLPTLWATSGYVEAKYKFVPRWYAAARFGFFEPDRVTDSVGAEHPWDYPVHRMEYGLGYKPMPRVTTKLVAQHNRFDGSASLDRDHYLVQISAGF